MVSYLGEGGSLGSYLGEGDSLGRRGGEAELQLGLQVLQQEEQLRRPQQDVLSLLNNNMTADSALWQHGHIPTSARSQLDHVPSQCDEIAFLTRRVRLERSYLDILKFENGRRTTYFSCEQRAIDSEMESG